MLEEPLDIDPKTMQWIDFTLKNYADYKLRIELINARLVDTEKAIQQYESSKPHLIQELETELQILRWVMRILKGE